MYALWAQRTNWPLWFPMVEEVGFRPETPDQVALNLWYRWGERLQLGLAWPGFAWFGRWVAGLAGDWLLLTLMPFGGAAAAAPGVPARCLPARPLHRVPTAPACTPSPSPLSTAMTPWLELVVVLRRTQEEKDKYIVEEPVEGAPIVFAALFTEDGPGATAVTLRVSYLLPREPLAALPAVACSPTPLLAGWLWGRSVTRAVPLTPSSRAALPTLATTPTGVLHEFAGAMAVYGDVDRKLGRCMAGMAAWIEERPFAEAHAAGEARMAEIWEGEARGGE